MKTIVLPVFAALSLGLSGAASAKTPRQKVIAIVTHEVRNDYQRPSAKNIAGTVRQIDIDGDRIADWQADFTPINNFAWCGTGGCRLMVWRGLPSGKLRKVFDDQVLKHRWGLLRGKRTLLTNQHGSNCGGAGSDDCPTNYQWNTRKSRLIQLPRPKRYRYHL